MNRRKVLAGLMAVPAVAAARGIKDSGPWHLDRTRCDCPRTLDELVTAIESSINCIDGPTTAWFYLAPDGTPIEPSLFTETNSLRGDYPRVTYTAYSMAGIKSEGSIAPSADNAETAVAGLWRAFQRNRGSGKTLYWRKRPEVAGNFSENRYYGYMRFAIV